jgi:hypothetical protein
MRDVACSLLSIAVALGCLEGGLAPALAGWTAPTAALPGGVIAPYQRQPAARAPAGVECPAGEGPTVVAPYGLTLCRATTRAPVRIEKDPQPGARIASVDIKGLAAQAGLMADDVIYRVGGERVSSGAEALDGLAKPGRSGLLQINYWRDGLPYIARLWVER